ncbi:MAG: PPOX class F420-dependent oxidoreductase [Chloroflexi bacterium]|nr:PPOX class F420-dependent oxidoreductase [Chloroflexota bacterium]
MSSLIGEPVRAFLEQPRVCVMGTINRDGSPQLTVMWYDLSEDVVILNMTRGLVKERNLRRDPRMSVCVPDGPRYVTLSGVAEIVEDRALQEIEVNRMAKRYRGARLGADHWQTIAHQDRLGIHLLVRRVQTHGLDLDGA